VRAAAGWEINMKALLFGLAALAMSATAAMADIVIFATPPYPPNPDENVLFDTGVNGLVVTGTTNQTDSTVIFTGQEQLVAPPNGQARIEAVDGAFTDLTIQLTDAALGFTSFEFNLNAATGGVVTLTFIDDQGTPFTGLSPYTLGDSGSNFFSALAINGQLITKVIVDSTVPLTDIAQVRLGGVTPLSAVPEPATWAMLILGFGMVGVGMRMRRREPDGVLA
jgi:hypothetical protein